ncbi:hypothetical protein ABZP36_021870 [Zizania latifolia]
MASSPAPPAAPFALLILLVPLALVLAQQPLQTAAGNSDATALEAVFKEWRLHLPEDPCMNLVRESFAKTASINCSCSDLNRKECRITHLSVTGYRNITHIPVELFNLTELVSLDLSNNNLSGSIAPGIMNLTKLEIWRFNSNQLNGSFPSELSSLRNLQSLWMFDNNIDGSFPKFIANFTNLTDLRIYGMKLRGPIPKEFSKLVNLTYLMIGDLHGNDSSFDFIGDLANLSTLSLRKCGLSGMVPNITLHNLTYIDLRSNNLSGPIEQVLRYNEGLKYLYVGENKFNGSLPSERLQSLLALDVTYNPSVSGSLPTDRKWMINYIGTRLNARRSVDSENLSLLNCLDMEECNRKDFNIVLSSINCGGKEYIDPLQTVFSDDSTDLGAAGFRVYNNSKWVVSHVGADPFGNSTSIVNTNKPIYGTNMSDIYRTARTSTGSLWYYVVGLTSGKYTVQLFFAEIVIESESGRRLFDIDIQDQTFKKDFNIVEEAGGSWRATNITYEVTINNPTLKIHLYWNGRGTCCIPREGTYGPLVSAIRVFPSPDLKASPPPAPDRARQDEKRRGVVAGIAALCIAAAVISSSVVYLWWKWVSLVKHSKA